MNLEKLIADYEVEVEFPDVSGMEHLQMLMRRSEIAKGDRHLTGEQHQRLLHADKLLYQQAQQFYEAIQDVADLSSWRHNQNVGVAHWWWYLDVISQIPVDFVRPRPSKISTDSQPILELS